MDADYACEKISGPAGPNYKLRQVKWSEERDGFEFDVRVFGDTICTRLERKNVSSQTVVVLGLDEDVGYIIQKDSQILTAMRNVECAISTSGWQAAMATWNKLSMSVPMKWRLKLREVVHRESPAGEPVRPREMSAPSEGGEEAVAPRVPPVPSKPTQSKMNIVPQAMQPVVRGVNIVSGVVDVSPHVCLRES